MLVKSALNGHYQAMCSSLKLLGKKPFVTLLTILILAITLLLPAFFWTLSLNLKKLSHGWQKEKSISLYLKPGLPPKEEKRLYNEIEKIKGIEKVSIKSANEALVELRKEEGMQNIMHYLEENPLPTVITVFPAEMSTMQLELLYKQLKSYPQIEETGIDLDWVKKLQSIFNLIRHIEQALTIILGIAVALIIGNAMRSIVLGQSEEIQVLKLIGAKNSYILRPFVYTGIFYGVLGGVAALIFLHICLFTLSLSVEELASSYGFEYSVISLNFYNSTLLLFSAIILGWCGAWLTVRKQISLIEPS